MFHPNISKEQVRALIGAMSDSDFARFLYCQHMAATFMAVAKFENMVVSAILICDDMKVGKTDRAADAGSELIRRHNALNASTLGSMIGILEKHNVPLTDISYLKWLKNKRDHFVHRLFQSGAWPGDLDQEGCRIMIRQLIAIQRWLERGEQQIWRILERAGFVDVDRCEGGLLVSNVKLNDPNFWG
ncbi:hypothetical protein [Vitreimonas sp.]|uniref:hypothetical protein n=1 Tax=Vitreimonas sp. TaxID=3069702 RepID=UPI002ED90453